MSENGVYIPKGCQITGEIKSATNVTIDGQLEGSIICDGDLVVGESGKVKSDIEAQNVYIKGEVHGKIIARNLLEVSPSGSVFGDITTNLLKFDQGARFIGSSSHSSENTTESDPPQDKGKESEPNGPKLSLKPIIYNRLAK